MIPYIDLPDHYDIAAIALLAMRMQEAEERIASMVDGVVSSGAGPDAIAAALLQAAEQRAKVAEEERRTVERTVAEWIDYELSTGTAEDVAMMRRRLVDVIDRIEVRDGVGCASAEHFRRLLRYLDSTDGALR